MELQPLQFRAAGRDYTVAPDPVWPRAVLASVAGNKRPVGRLSWNGPDNGPDHEHWNDAVSGVDVLPAHQRRGVATAMWQQAKQMNPNLRHSHTRTSDGQAWSAKVGD
jgi:GNAT superfamily N-acetyltransferase